MKRFVTGLPYLLLLLLCTYVPVHAQDEPFPADPDVLLEMRHFISFIPTITIWDIRGTSPEILRRDYKAEMDSIQSRMPRTGDALIKIISEKDNPMRMVAMTILSLMWDQLTPAQIAPMAQAHITPYVTGHTEYLKGDYSYIRTGFLYALQFEEKNRVQTRSYNYLDGEQHLDSFQNAGSMADTGGVSVRFLDYGTHTVKTVTEYELKHEGRIIKGRAESPVFTFEIVRELAPPTPTTPHTEEQGNAVRNGTGFIESRRFNEKEIDSYSYYPTLSEPWCPSSTIYPNGSGDIYAVHFPYFSKFNTVPVELSFDVEIELVDTGEILEGKPIFAGKNTFGDFPLEPKDWKSIIFDEEGFVRLKATLTPAKPATSAQNETRQYYNGSFESPVMRAKLFRFSEETAPAWLKTLRDEVEHFKQEGEASKSAIGFSEDMASLNPFKRARAAHICKRTLTPEEMMKVFPFLIALLHDTDADMLHPPAEWAQKSIASIGEPAIEPLIAVLAHNDSTVRAGAVATLGRIGSPIALAALENALSDSDADVRDQVDLALDAINYSNSNPEFEDRNLEAKVRAAIGRPTGEIRRRDVLDVGFTSLSASSSNITSLKGLEFCTDLTRIQLGRNSISDLSPLKKLTKLTSVSLDKNQIKDLTPLAELAEIEYLGISSNPVATLEPLTHLPKLRRLRAEKTNLTNLLSISGMTELEDLHVAENQISNISGISRLTKLEQLNLDKNRITDLSHLAGLEALTTLSIRNNQIADIKVLATIKTLELIVANSNQISNVEPLGDLHHLRVLDLSNNPIEDIEPLGNLSLVYNINLAQTNIRDLTPLARLGTLTSLGLSHIGENRGKPPLVSPKRHSPPPEMNAENATNPEIDFGVLSTLTGLTSLSAAQNGITDLSFVRNMGRLEHLSLDRNNIENIDALANLDSLTSLSLTANLITDIAPLAGLSNLSHIRLATNRIANIEALRNLLPNTEGRTSINLTENPLDNDSLQTYIPELERKGISVYITRSRVGRD